MNAHNEQQGFTAGDIADQGARQFEAGRASVLAEQPAAQEAVAWTVVGPDGKSSIGGWQDMKTHDFWKEAGVLREGHRYAYAYAAPVTAAPACPACEGRPSGENVPCAICKGSPAAPADARTLAMAVEKALGWRDGERDAELDSLLETAMSILDRTPAAPGIDLASLRDIASDLSHSAKVDDYEPQQIAFIESIHDRLLALIDASPKGGSDALDAARERAA